MNIYHETPSRIYYDCGDGMLRPVWKKKFVPVRTFCPVIHLRNDELGREYYDKYLRGKVAYVLYRCPKAGRTYDSFSRFPKSSRRGNLPKNDCLVMYVRLKDTL